jgi:hypothetical protein
MADVYYMINYRPFDILAEPCANCATREGCCTTCPEAQIWFDQVAEVLKGKES